MTERNGSLFSWYRPSAVIVSSITSVNTPASTTGSGAALFHSRTWKPSTIDWNSTAASTSVSSSVRTER